MVAHLADPVAAVVQAKGGGLDAGEILLRSLNECRQLCSFVGDGLALGVVLVIGIRARGCGEQGLEILGHGLESGADLLSLLTQALSRSLKIQGSPRYRRQPDLVRFAQ